MTELSVCTVPACLVPAIRITVQVERSARAGGTHVLYWMTAHRRRHDNFALQRAVSWARALKKPLLICEALRSAYPLANARMHRFVIEGMAANTAAFADAPVTYLPYVEPTAEAGKGLLAALAADACVVIGDEFPCYFAPRMIAAATRQLAALEQPVRFEIVDSNGLMPLRATPKAFGRAVDYRRFWQGTLLTHLRAAPAEDPLAGVRLPRLSTLPTAMLSEIAKRWPTADPVKLLMPGGLAALPIDHSIGNAWCAGGAVAAEQMLSSFVRERLTGYPDATRNASSGETSGLSPYLHWGHLSAHRALRALLEHAGWSPDRVCAKPNGSREGWWGVDAVTEAVLDQLVTWRELGYNFCQHTAAYDRYESLPAWAQKTLSDHAGDLREHLYTCAQFAAAQTHDPLWNAAQRQLVREGRIHTYLRMLWAKKILEWSPSPEDALATCIELNNRYAVDGCNPNSYSGIFWNFGRYDRPWAPSRPIFGCIRYMSSASAITKVKVKGYLVRWAESAAASAQQTLF